MVFEEDKTWISDHSFFVVIGWTLWLEWHAADYEEINVKYVQ